MTEIFVFRYCPDLHATHSQQRHPKAQKRQGRTAGKSFIPAIKVYSLK
jgi:hypothetical protein